MCVEAVDLETCFLKKHLSFSSSSNSTSTLSSAAAGSSSSSWAHELVAAENGCVLLSNMEHHFGQRYFESAVITLIEHGENGTVGMITNRPMTQTVRLGSMGLLVEKTG